jgi:hypothetical protein
VTAAVMVAGSAEWKVFNEQLAAHRSGAVLIEYFALVCSTQCQTAADVIEHMIKMGQRYLFFSCTSEARGRWSPSR